MTAAGLPLSLSLCEEAHKTWEEWDGLQQSLGNVFLGSKIWRKVDFFSVYNLARLNEEKVVKVFGDKEVFVGAILSSCG